MTESPKNKVRYQAIQSLIRLRREKVSAVLITLLDHSDGWTRRIAAAGLGTLKSVDAIPKLISKLHEEMDQCVRAAIVWSLGDIGDPSTIPEIISIIDEEDNGIFTQSPFEAALYALKLNNNEAALEALYRVINTGSRWSRRMSAVEALRRIGPERDAADRMVDLLEHENDTVRTTAAKELGFLGASTEDLELRDHIVGNLIKRLHDTGAGYHWSPTVAHMAAKSLYYVGTTEAIQAREIWVKDRRRNGGVSSTL